MKDLALEVRNVDLIIIDDTNGPNPSCGEIEKDRATKPTCTNNEDLGLGQLLLPLNSNLWKDKMTGMPLHIDHVDAY
jgi:hypothetical protein